MNVIIFRIQIIAIDLKYEKRKRTKRTHQFSSKLIEIKKIPLDICFLKKNSVSVPFICILFICIHICVEDIGVYSIWIKSRLSMHDAYWRKG